MGKVASQEELIQIVAREKHSERRVVFTNGCFDLLHPGHVRCLAAASAKGNLLIVAINSDSSVFKLKGPGRPFVPQQDRAEVLAALTSVDYVTIFDELTPLPLIEKLQPDVLVKGADWKVSDIVGRAEVEAAGGSVETIPLVTGYSTSALVERIRQSAEASRKLSADRHI
jgi:rfaE bifunctional protein nucleotidyltransferase chain/domain